MDFRILGPVEVDGAAPGGPRQRGVLAVLLLHANAFVSAERLVAAVWGEDAPPSAVKALQVSVSRLRRALGDPRVIETTAAGYRVRTQPGELDLERFERAVADGGESLAAGRPERAAAQLRDALALWRGPPLADLASMPFAIAEIARLEEQRLVALEARIEADLALGRHAELVGELRGLVAEHPWRERPHAQLMLALYRSGRQADALDAYVRARATLVEELGIEPGAELQELQRGILAHDPALAPPGAVRPPALPSPPAALFGRAGDLDRLCARIRRSRLVTIVGPGGVGKTSLALAAALRLGAEFADGARFVALAAVSDVRELEPAIERELGVPVDAGEPLGAALRRYLAEREVLLVLDNFEQLVTGAPLVGELLGACSRLTAVVTSREPTGLSAERVYALAPLDGDAAIEMFVDRVRAHEPEFELDVDAAPHLRQICERVDCLPLAVELAAARIGLLSPAELAARLDRALPVLAGGRRDAPERHRTLRATIDWSFGLLDEPEQEAFIRFAVFVGGATVAAAEEVTGATLDTLHALVTKQLLRRRADRLVMLALVREYALERLDEDPGADAIHRRLAAWCIAFARSETRRLAGPALADALGRLGAELPSALSAMRWALGAGEDEAAADLVIAWGRYWHELGRRDDGIPWVEAALMRAPDQDRLAHLRLTRARLNGVRRLEQYRADLEAALAHFRAAEDAEATASCLGLLSFAYVWVDDYDRARRIAEEAVLFAEQTQDERVLAHALTDRAGAGDGYDDIAAGARAAIPVLRKVGNVSALARLCSITGFVAISERREAEAMPWLEEALEAVRSTPGGEVVIVLGNIGLVKLLGGDLDAAEAALVEAVALSVWSASAPLIDEPLLALAAVHGQRGDFERAALLAGVANANPTEGRHVDEDRVWRRLTDEFLEPARERAGAQMWDRIAQRGAALTPREVLDLAQRREPVPAARH